MAGTTKQDELVHFGGPKLPILDPRAPRGETKRSLFQHIAWDWLFQASHNIYSVLFITMPIYPKIADIGPCKYGAGSHWHDTSTWDQNSSIYDMMSCKLYMFVMFVLSRQAGQTLRSSCLFSFGCTKELLGGGSLPAEA